MSFIMNVLLEIRFQCFKKNELYLKNEQLASEFINGDAMQCDVT